jgi:MFS family permease
MNVQVAVTLLVAAVAGARGTWSPCGLSMVSAINPMAERSRGYRYGLTVAWFVTGAVLGGALLGGAAALGAWALSPFGGHRSALLVVAVVACLVTLAADLRVGGFSLPMIPRQVNERWLMRYRRWLYAGGFGVQIGLGVATYVMTAAVYLTIALAVLTASPPLALLAGLTFALVRGLAVLLTAPVRDPEALRALHRRLETLAPWSVGAAAAVQALAAIVLAGAAAGALAATALTVSLSGALLVQWRGVARHSRVAAPLDAVGWAARR